MVFKRFGEVRVVLGSGGFETLGITLNFAPRHFSKNPRSYVQGAMVFLCASVVGLFRNYLGRSNNCLCRGNILYRKPTKTIDLVKFHANNVNHLGEKCVT